MKMWLDGAAHRSSHARESFFSKNVRGQMDSI